MVYQLQNLKRNKGCFKLYKVNGSAFNLILLSVAFANQCLYSHFIYNTKFFVQSFTKSYLEIFNVDSP